MNILCLSFLSFLAFKFEMKHPGDCLPLILRDKPTITPPQLEVGGQP